MCGILGFNWDDASLVKKMQAVMHYRGPDQEGRYSDSLVSLGHLRLSIIDLSEKARQPMSNEDDSIFIVFNGEIYNFQEIKEDLEKRGHRFKSASDTEVIIHAYEEYGTDCLKLFNGMFAFCIYDSRAKKLFLARDRTGIKPVFYFFDGDKFIFASELKAILEHGIDKVLNRQALDSFMACRYDFLRETFFKGIFKLLPAEYLTFDLKRKHLERKSYWSLEFSSSSGSLVSLQKRLGHLLHDSVKMQMISDVPLGAFLSGGIDSSTVVALMHKINAESGSDGDIKTFSVGFNLEKDYDDLRYARIVADRFGTDHKEIIIEPSSIVGLPDVVWHLDSPISAPDALPTYLMSLEAKKDVTVVLTGNGADELFGGYEHYKFLNMGRYVKHVPKVVRRSVLPFFVRNAPMSVMSKFFKYPSKMGKKGISRATDFLGKLDDELDAYTSLVYIFDEGERKALFAFADDKNMMGTKKEIGAFFSKDNSLLNKAIERETKHFLADCVLVVSDRTAMGASLEARVPFLDNCLMEFALSLPQKYKLNGLREKYLLKKTVAHMLPKEVISRTKQGFYVPLDLWLGKDLRPLMDDILDPRVLKRQGLFNPATITKMRSQLSHSKLYAARQLWCVLSFQMWHEMFFEGASRDALKRRIRI